MQVFIIGTPLETAKALDNRRLNKQIIECQQILNALNGAKAWSNHPCVLQYRGHEEWLKLYTWCLEDYYTSIRYENASDMLYISKEWSDMSIECKPPFHNEEFFEQMKRRLYTKNPHHYSQWSYLGKSLDNWYFVNGEWRIYENGKRIK